MIEWRIMMDTNNMRRIVNSVIITTIMIFTLVICVLFITDRTYATEIIDSGTCGDNLIWELDDEGLLTISGTGDMYDYVNTNGPWDSPRIKKVIISEGITSIGYSAFKGCDSLGSIELPDGLTNIAFGAFENCSSLSSIVIPESVRVVHGNTFKGCSSLERIVLPDSLTKIDGAAFWGCSSLTSINIPDGVSTIGIYAFRECSSLTNITIPKRVTKISCGIFMYCRNLKNLSLPEGVNIIEEFAFKYCDNLTSFTIPSGVTIINTETFNNCSSLENISIPDSVSYIGSKAFTGCKSLKTITIPYKVTRIQDQSFYGCSNLKSITLPDGLTDIENYAFQNCSSLTSIKIPDSVTSIGDQVFCGCSSLMNIIIPDGVTNIGKNTFYNCNELMSITIPEGVTNIGEKAFYGCGKLESVEISSSIISIGTDAFYNCKKMKYIFIDADTGALKTNSMRNCNATLFCKSYSKLSSGNPSPVYPSDITIARYYGNMDSNTEALLLPDNITTLPNNLFNKYSNIKYVYVPSGTTVYNPGMGNVERVWYEGGAEQFDSLGYFDYSIFQSLAEQDKIQYCVNREELVSIKECTVSGIESKAYTGGKIKQERIKVKHRNQELVEGTDFVLDYSNNVNAGEASVSIRGIGTCYGSKDCSFEIEKIPVSSVTITDIPEQIYEGINVTPKIEVLINGKLVEGEGGYTVSYSNNDSIGTGLATITLGNNYYGDNVIYKSFAIVKGPAAIIDQGVCGKKLTWTIDSDNTLTINGDGPMDNYSALDSDKDNDLRPWNTYNIKKIVIAEGVTTIGDYAFMSEEQLMKVEIPESVASIGDESFSKCYSLENISLPYSLKAIGKSAFKECRSLKSIKIPKNVTNINASAFSYCLKLTRVTLSDNLTNINQGTFEHCNKISEITIPNKVKSIGSSAFDGCVELRNVKLSSDLNAIGRCAFSNCKKLATIEIPSKVESIGYRAFYNCSNMRKIILKGSSLKKVEEAAFYLISNGPLIVIENSSLKSKYTVLLLKGSAPLKEKVIFIPSGGKVTPKFKDVYYKIKYGQLPTPIRTGYKFTGWYTKNSEGARITSNTLMENTGNHNLYAHWTKLPLKLTKTKLTLKVGTTYILKVKNKGKKKVKWISSNKKVAIVSSGGKVKAKKKGKAVITAKVGSKKLRCIVTVKRKVYLPSMNKTEVSLIVDNTYQLSVKNKGKATVKWSSSNRNVATVSSTGKVKAIGQGKAIITAKVNNKSLKCTVTVTTRYQPVIDMILKETGGTGVLKQEYSSDKYKTISALKVTKNGDVLMSLDCIMYYSNGRKQSESVASITYNANGSTKVYIQTTTVLYNLSGEAIGGTSGEGVFDIAKINKSYTYRFLIKASTASDVSSQKLCNDSTKLALSSAELTLYASFGIHLRDLGLINYY